MIMLGRPLLLEDRLRVFFTIIIFIAFIGLKIICFLWAFITFPALLYLLRQIWNMYNELVIQGKTTPHKVSSSGFGLCMLIFTCTTSLVIQFSLGG